MRRGGEMEKMGENEDCEMKMKIFQNDKFGKKA
jgi:hypothetical protein